MMQKATFVLPVQNKRVNAFYEQCARVAKLWNNASPKKVTPKRFMRDVKENRRAYELAEIDFNELLTREMTSQDQARLFFGKLKRRKVELCSHSDSSQV
jgi:hypothetical protein